MTEQHAPATFFQPDLQPGSTTLSLTAEEWHHARVLRLAEGERIRLVNGNDIAAIAEISTLAKKSAQCRILSLEQLPPPPGRCLHIAMSTIRSSRMDYAVEKLAEMGIGQLSLFYSEFTSVRIFKEKHWCQIAISAMKQSGQAGLMQLHPPLPFEELLNRHAGANRKYIAHPDAAAAAAAPAAVQSDEQLLVLIGPEGGFSHTETGRARSGGFQTLNLGTTILRAETAAVVAAAQLLCR